MRPIVHIGRFTWSCACFTCHCANFLLITLAFLQGGVLLLNVAQKEVPLPDKLTRIITNRLTPGDLEAYWAKAVFDLRAGLLLDDFVLLNRSTEQTLATAKTVRIQWSLMQILFRTGLPVRDLDAMEVQFYLPANQSPSGLNEPALAVKHLSLDLREENLRINNLIMQTGQVRVHLTGSAPLQFFRTGTGERRDFNPWKALRTIRRLPPDLRALVDISWEMTSPDRHQLALQAQLPVLTIGSANLARLDASARMSWSNDGLGLSFLALDGIFNGLAPEANSNSPSLPFAPPPMAFHLSGAGARWNGKLTQLPSVIEASARSLNPQFPVQNLYLSTHPGSGDFSIDWIIKGENLFASGQAFPADSRNSPADLPSSLRSILFNATLDHPAFADYVDGPAPDRRLVGCQADRLILDGSFQIPSRSLQAIVQTDGFVIGQTFFAHLKTDLFLDPQRLAITNAHIRKALDEIAYGSYFHEFATSRFSLNAAGHIYPTSLYRILGDWWIDIFTDIQAPVPIPGNVTVWGSWRDIDSLHHITHAHGKGAIYKGVEIPDLEIRVRSNEQWASIEMLRARFPDGEFGGTVGIRLGMEEEPWRATVLDLRSSANWAAVCGASALEELRQMEFMGGNPDLTVEGVFWQPQAGNPALPVSRMEISLHQPRGTCRVAGLDLDGLNLGARVRGQTIALEPLTGNFAEGVFTGGIYVGNWQDPARQFRHYDLELFDAQYGLALEQLSGLSEDPESFRTSLLGENREGRLDVDFNLWKNQPDSAYEGFGFLTLRQAQIGQIHLFGGLSRLLTGMGLGFSSLNLNSMSAEWRIAEQVLNIENGLVTGPVLELAVLGDIDLDKRVLDLQTEVTFFSGMISKVMSPVSDTLQFDLTGHLENPNWKFRFKPFRWFQNRIAPQPEAFAR